MKRILPVLMVSVAFLLQGCGGNNMPEQAVFLDGTACHRSFINKAYNKPYEIKGNTYYPQKHYNYSETGLASFYGGGDVFHGRKTSNGEIFDMNRLSAAHKTLPIPCVVLVTNRKNGRSIRLKINDRGPFIPGRIIDVSRKAARMLGFEQDGVTLVNVEVLISESLVLADNMARGSKGNLPFNDQQIVLAEAHKKQVSQGKPSQKTSHGTRSVHLATLNTANRSPQQKAHTESRGSARSTENPSIYSDAPLPEILLTSQPATGHKRVNSGITPAAIRPAVQTQETSPLPAAKKRKIMLVIQPAVAQTKKVIPALSSNTGFFIQAGTFSSFVNAQKLATSLKNHQPNLPVKMQPIKVRNQQMFRVLVGPFQDNARAQMLAGQFQGSSGSPLMIVHE